MWLLSVAFALPVVHDVEPADAVRLASEQLGAGFYEPLSLADLRAMEPDAAAGSALQVCRPGGSFVAPSLAGLRSAVLKAEGVEEALAEARNAAVCHGAEASQVSRMAFLAGIASAQAGDTDAARDHFRDALAVEPTLEWDGDFAARFSTAFDAVRAERVALQRLEVTPMPATVNGAAVPAEVRPGLHLLEVREQHVWLDLGPAPEQVRVPAAAPDDVLSWAQDERRRDLSNLLSAAVGEGTEIAVVHDRVVWTGRTGRTDWTPHRSAPLIATPPALPPPPAKRTRVSGVGIALLSAGLGLAVASGTLAGVQYGRAADGGLPAGDTYNRAKTLYQVGTGGAVLGGVLGATGAVTMVVTR